MKPTYLSTPRLAVLLLLLATLFLDACRRKSELVPINPEFAKYVESYTSGTISKTNVITVKLLPGIAKEHLLNEPVKETLFRFSPSVDGDAYWVDERTVEFRPSKHLKPGELYEVQFMLGKVASVPGDLETFRFNAKVLDPSFLVKEKGLRTDGNSKIRMVFSGEVVTADREDSARVEKILQVSADGKNMDIQWRHEAGGRNHAFEVNNIERKKEAGELRLSWKGDAIDAKETGASAYEIPAIGDFKVLGITAVYENENYISVQFSAPIHSASDLRGLIATDPGMDLTYSVQGSEVKAFLSEDEEGTFTVVVHPGIENVWGEKLAKGLQASVVFESRKPSVKILGNGEIIPGSGKVMLPFEATNLSAVDVSIVRVYENNIPQFFQVNTWDEGSQLRRVGRPVVQQTIRLDNDKGLDLTRRQRFSLDLDRLMKAEPGALYRITIGFRPEYSLYRCTDSTGSGDGEESDYEDYYDGGYEYSEHPWEDEDDKFWSTYDSYYPFGFDWDEQDNPCHPSYYNKNRWETRNLMASNLGLTVKRGNDKSMTVLVTDLVTAEPASNVSLELLDFQRQVVHKAETDGKGLATFSLKARPFLLVAKRGAERGYLKLDDGNSLLISRFDVSGDEVANGIKGFIYGERGVWRPGDSLYINFMLEDKDKLIPAEHPVEFTLFTPTGQLYKKMISHGGMEGLYTFRTATDASAPTGNWTAKVKVGGSTFEKRIKIETVMPNRLKIFLDFKDGNLLQAGGSQPVTLTSRWLFGAPAQNLNAKVDVTLSRNSTAFNAYPAYVFEDPSLSFDAETKTVFDGKLNEEGTVTFAPGLDQTQDAPGMLKAGFLVKVFEPGGAFSIDQFSIPYSPYSSYVGLRVPKGEEPWDFLLTGKNYTVDLVNVTPQGKPVAGAGEVTAEIYKLEWRWWWDNSGGGPGNYASSQYSRLVKREQVKLNNGTGKWKISIPEEGWGRYFVSIIHPDGHRAGKIVYFDDPYWQSRNRLGDASSATMLSFSADKTVYNVGETATLNIPSSSGAKIFISLENGRKVLQTHFIDTRAGQTVFSFKITPEMAPNIYAFVSLVQPHAQTVNDRPIRMYGLIPIEVKDPQTILKPRIAMPDVIRPEQPFSITVSEESGKEMVYSLAIVDEGLLDLTRFKTPDPHAAFYAKEALGVKTWDIFDHVIGSQGGNLGRILTIGGDEGLNGAGKQKGANRFEPVVRYMGPFPLKKGESKTHSVTLPPYFGSVRVMVVAGRAAQYGSAEKTVAVRSPLMINATLPRVLGPSEEIRIPVTVFATENSVKQTTVEVESSPAVEIVGAGKKTVTFTGPGEQTVYFDAKVKPYTGFAEVKVKAYSGANKAQSRTAIEVRNPNPPITRVEAKNLAPRETWNGRAVPIGVPATSKVVLEVSSAPPINLQKRIGYLIQYPHGCVEQTTSAVFAQLVLGELTDLGADRKKDVDRNIKAAITRLRNFQVHDGGFAYWQGGRQADEWGTNYAGHFLLEAKAKGYFVPDDMLASWLKYQKNKANRWSAPTQSYEIYASELTQSYRLYLLALARAPEVGAMNRFKEFGYVSTESKWRLAAAYKMAGYDRVAEAMVKTLPVSFRTQNDYGYTFGSELRNKAMVLEACALLGMHRQGGVLAEQIAAQLSTDEWLSTQTTAYALIAMSKFNGTSTGRNKIDASFTVGGQTVPLVGTSYTMQVPVAVTAGAVLFKLVNNGSGLLYARLTRQGQPLPEEAVAETPSASNLGFSVEFMDFSGKPVDTKNIGQGKDFLAKARIVNPGGRGTYKNMALSMIFPSGWEIINTRLWDAGSAFVSSSYTYQDIRDDRVYIYFDLKEKETKTYYVMLNGAYAGKYYLPMMTAEAMYDHAVSAGTPGQWVQVVP